MRALSLKSLLSGSVGFAYLFYLQVNLAEWSIKISDAFIRSENKLKLKFKGNYMISKF